MLLTFFVFINRNITLNYHIYADIQTSRFICLYS